MTGSYLPPPPRLKNPVSPAALRGRDGTVLHDPSEWLAEQRAKGDFNVPPRSDEMQAIPSLSKGD